MFMLKRPEPKLTVAHKALLRARQIDARGLFAVVNALLLLLVGYAGHRFPHKFVRVTGECATNWVQLGADERVVCCDAAGRNTEAPCHYGMDLAPVLASPKGAWVLPMLAVIANYVALMLLDDPTMPRIRVVTRRAALYIGVMLLRTLVLYMGLNHIEHAAVALLHGGATSDAACWYKDKRRNGACAPHFDHSDHIVLLVAHYLAVTLFEWFALSVEIAAPAARSAKKTVLQLWMVLLSIVTVYTLFNTASFFHSTMENVIGLLVAQLGAMLPLYLITQDYFGGNSWLRLRNFVLPADAEDPMKGQ